MGKASHGSIIFNSERMEATQIFNNRGMFRLVRAHLYNEVWCHCKKKQGRATYVIKKLSPKYFKLKKEAKYKMICVVYCLCIRKGRKWCGKGVLVQAAKTKIPYTMWLKQQTLFPIALEARESKVKVVVEPVPGESPLSGLQTADSLPCPHVAERGRNKPSDVSSHRVTDPTVGRNIDMSGWKKNKTSKAH